MQHLSVKARAFISWIAVKCIDPDQVEKGLLFSQVQPTVHKGKSKMIQVQMDEKSMGTSIFKSAFTSLTHSRIRLRKFFIRHSSSSLSTRLLHGTLMASLVNIFCTPLRDLAATSWKCRRIHLPNCTKRVSRRPSSFFKCSGSSAGCPMNTGRNRS